MKKAQKLKIGIIGAGRIGRLHTENILRNIPTVKIVCIADPCVDLTKAWVEQFGIEDVTPYSSEVIDNPEIDAVVICSPTNTHAELIIDCADKGKHIFCEKPIDIDIDSTTEAIRAVERGGVKLQIGFNRRFDHNFAKISKFLREGSLGSIRLINITSRDPEPPSTDYIMNSGGIFIDMSIHDFDMTRYLTRSNVIEVYAIGKTMNDFENGEARDHDTAVVVLKMENDAICTINNSRRTSYGYDQRIEVFGSRGNIVALNDRSTNVVISTDQGVFIDKPLYFFLERYLKSFENEMKDFFEKLATNSDLSVTGEDGLEAILIAKAAAISAKEGIPVKLDTVRERTQGKHF